MEVDTPTVVTGSSNSPTMQGDQQDNEAYEGLEKLGAENVNDAALLEGDVDAPEVEGPEVSHPPLPYICMSV